MSLLWRAVSRSVLHAARRPSEESFFLGAAGNVSATNPCDSRGKRSLGGGTTRNRRGRPAGKKYGIKVYDGQRVPADHLLCSQLRVSVLPGWNVRFSTMSNLRAVVPGRVMITTERCEPKYDAGIPQVEKFFPAHLRGRNIFRLHMHIVPDQPHQYFKLVEQV